MVHTILVFSQATSIYSPFYLLYRQPERQNVQDDKLLLLL